MAIAIASGSTELYLNQDYSGTILEFDGGDTGYFYAYLGADNYTEGNTEFTLDAIYVYGPESVVDVFNSNNVINLDSGMATSVTLTIGEHNGMNCVAFKIAEGINLYLYLADEV